MGLSRLRIIQTAPSQKGQMLQRYTRDGLAAADRPPDEAESSGWTATSGSLDCPPTQLYFGRTD